ncbi:134_t:CDS:2 [Ambispora gerdemannii]|uniref:134_t:CDS:1 n=1 Tax=Ambispora gerdemannii TaxID=144530 RepID=A0A9N9D986_9GLOM|nr:134_t:CDS:2 [Ambispora gerdemannii]
MSRQKKKPYGFDGKYMFSETDATFYIYSPMLTKFLAFKSYFAWASEHDVDPSLSEFIRLNVDFVARSSEKNDSGARTSFVLTASLSFVLALVMVLEAPVVEDKPNWSYVTEKMHKIQISESRREKTYIMYSNENEHVGNELLEDQEKSELDTSNSADAKTTRISRLTKRLLDVAKESPPKRLAKQVVKDDSNDPFIISGTLDELVVSGTSDGNDSDKSYHPSSDEPDDDTFVEIKKRINYTYDWFTGPGIKKSSLSEGAKKWVIDTLDVSSLLLEYRDMSVQRASENKIQEVAEILSLNHIFLFEQNVTIGVSSMIIKHYFRYYQK